MESFRSFIREAQTVPSQRISNSYKDFFIRLLQHYQLTYDSTDDKYLLQRPDLIYCEYDVPSLTLPDNVNTVKASHSEISTAKVSLGRRILNIALIGSITIETNIGPHNPVYNLYWPFTFVNCPGDKQPLYHEKWKDISTYCNHVFGQKWVRLDTGTISFTVEPGPEIHLKEFFDPYILKKKKPAAVSSYEDPFELGSKGTI
jgi:hypothetical protein